MAGHYVVVDTGRTQRTKRGLGDVWGTITQGIQSATSILAPRYAVPQLAPGQYMVQQTPQGMLAVGQGSVASSMIGQTNISQILMIGMLGLLAVAAMSAMGGRH